LALSGVAVEKLFLGISRMKFVCKLNVRSPWTAKFGEITALVPFSTATGD
jgi:hypothetical protein